MVDENGLKPLSCVFLDDVLCSYRKDAKFGIMDRCLKCPHYEQFVREMEDEEEKFWAEVDEAERARERYLSGGLR